MGACGAASAGRPLVTLNPVVAERVFVGFCGLVVLFAMTAVGWAQDPAGSQGGGPGADPTSEARRRDRPELTQIQRAVQVFRRITAEQNLRLGQQADRVVAAASNGSRAHSWHGRVFEYFRNDILDAVPHEVVQRGGQRNLRRRNQFGFTVNGPVVLPQLYNGRGSSFFTFSYEGTRERVGRSYLYSMPTDQQRLADFSDLVNRAGKPLTVYDPASTRRNPAYDPGRKVSRSNLEYVRDPFPDNRIPSVALDRVAQAAIRDYPQPNTNVGPFLRNNYWTNPSERNTPDGFIIRLDHNLGDIQKIDVSANASNGFSDTPELLSTVANPGRPDRTFRTRTISISDTVNPSPTLTFNGRFRANLDVVDTLSSAQSTSFPEALGLAGVGGSVFPAFRFRGYLGMGASSRSYLRNALTDYRFDNSLVVRRGNHTWTVSSDTLLLHWNTLELDAPSGTYSFNDRITGLPGITNTGDGFATFLLGQAWNAEATDQPHPAYLRRSGFENSVSDQWQVSPDLTMSMRVVLAANSPRFEKHDRQSSFDLDAPNPATGSSGALVFAGRDGVGRAFQPYRVRLEPRLAVSWSPMDSRDTVVRGTMYRTYGTVGLRRGPFGTQGFSGRRSPISPNRQLLPAVKLDGGFPALAHPLPDLRGDFANNTDVDLIPRTDAQPTYNQLSLEVEHKLPRGLTLRARGRTIRGRDLLIGGHLAGINAVPVTALIHRDRLYDEMFRRSLRPFPHVQQIRANYQYPGGKYRYDEGRINVLKRTGDGLSFDFEYSYRMRWDDYSGPGIQDRGNRRTAWGLSRGIRPQRLSLSYTYELPVGPGRVLLARRGILAKFISDWSVSGFTSWLSGDPIALEPLFNNTGGVVPYLRVDAVAGVDPHVRDPGPEAWFNPAAFVDPADFTVGNVPRTHPTLRNPNYSNHDIALTKRVVISQDQSVEFLVQSFNFVNQGNWNDPDTEIGPSHARNANAGKIIGSRGGRVLQLGLRYHF